MFREILALVPVKLFIIPVKRVGSEVVRWPMIYDRWCRERDCFDKLRLKVLNSFEHQCICEGEKRASEVHSHAAGTCSAIIAGGVIEAVKQ